MSDLLEQLEQEFGLTETQIESVTLYGHKWSLRKLDYDDIDKANTFIFRRSAGEAADDDSEDSPLDNVEPLVFGFRSSLSFVSVSLSAIDDQPVCFIFKTAKPEEVAPFNPLTPPIKIRHRTADRVHRFLSGSKKNMDLVMQLYDLYTEKLDDRAKTRRAEAEAEAKAAETEAKAKDSSAATVAEKSAADQEAASANPLTESGPTPPPSAG